MSINDIANKIGPIAKGALLVAHAPPWVQSAIREAAELEHKRQKEILTAEHLDITVDELRFMQAFPELQTPLMLDNWQKVSRQLLWHFRLMRYRNVVSSWFRYLFTVPEVGR